MFVNHNQIRTVIFFFFSILIITMSLYLTYLITYFKEDDIVNEQETNNDCNNMMNYIDLAIKATLAFCAGGILSDLKWIKLGTA